MKLQSQNVAYNTLNMPTQIPEFSKSGIEQRDNLEQMSVMIDDSGDEDCTTEIDQHQSVLDESVFGGYARPLVDKDNINKQIIKELPCNLHNIARCLQVIFKQLKMIDSKNVILALGNTGCGKSTMLNSLINGSDSLRTFRDKQKKKMVIQVKDGFKEDFVIGHSTTSSQTFLPCFKKLSEELFFADIAGFHDTSGDLVEFINCFVNKKIFLRAT